MCVAVRRRLTGNHALLIIPCLVVPILLSMACSSKKDTSLDAQMTAFVRSLALTENEPGLYESTKDGVTVRYDNVSGDIYFSSCPNFTRLATDMDYRARWEHRYETFFKRALPDWRDAHLAFTQIWESMETSKKKEITLPFNNLVIKLDVHTVDCRTLTISN